MTTELQTKLTITKPIFVPESQPQATGMAKTAPLPVSEPEEAKIVEPPKPMEALSAASWEGVPTDIIRYFIGEQFGTISSKTIEFLRDINDWSKQDLLDDTIGNRLQKIRSLESKLGAPGIHESKLEKMWNWCRMAKNINELRKRQSAFER